MPGTVIYKTVRSSLHSLDDKAAFSSDSSLSSDETVGSLEYKPLAGLKREKTVSPVVNKTEPSVLTISFSAPYHTGEDLKDYLVDALKSYPELEIQLPYTLLIHGEFLTALKSTGESELTQDLVALIRTLASFNIKHVTNLQQFNGVDEHYERFCNSSGMQSSAFLEFTAWLRANQTVFSLKLDGSRFSSENIKLNPRLAALSQGTESSHKISLWEEWKQDPLYEPIYQLLKNYFFSERCDCRDRVGQITSSVLKGKGIAKESLNALLSSPGLFENDDVDNKVKAAFLLAKFSCLKFIFAEVTVMILWLLKKCYGNLLYPVTKNPICKDLFDIAVEITNTPEAQALMAKQNISTQEYDLKLVDSILTPVEMDAMASTSPTTSDSGKKVLSTSPPTKAPILHLAGNNASLKRGGTKSAFMQVPATISENGDYLVFYHTVKTIVYALGQTDTIPPEEKYKVLCAVVDKAQQRDAIDPIATMDMTSGHSNQPEMAQTRAAKDKSFIS